ncbi:MULTISPECIES: hypothetical protein [Streptomyces]|nr:MULTISPECIES: hypothetical protein [Streptomyces]
MITVECLACPARPGSGGEAVGSACGCPLGPRTGWWDPHDVMVLDLK